MVESRAKARTRTLVFWLLGRRLPLLVGGVALFFLADLLRRFDQDTTPITNGAFAVIATLAALSLSTARVTKGLVRVLYTRAGEHLLFAAFLVILASVLRYCAMRAHEALQNSPSVLSAIDFCVGSLIGLNFGMAMVTMFTGTRHLIAALELRSLEDVTTRIEAETTALEGKHASVPALPEETGENSRA